jgi:putative sterol carrier protein
MPQLFTIAWAEAWGVALNASDTYARVARDWDGAVVMEAQADPARGLPETIAVFLDLAHGRCRAARIATPDDRTEAAYVISGPLASWLSVLNGDMSPTSAILHGQLSLQKGSLMRLMPHVHAATEMVRVAQTIPRGDGTETT